MATAVPPDLAPGAPASRRSMFFPGLSIVLLLLLFLGFAPTFFLNPIMANRPMPPHVFIHGILGTAWFVLLAVQASLVAGGQTDLHRKLGAAGVILAAAITISIAVSAYALFPRLTALGFDPVQVMQMDRVTQIVRDTLGGMVFAAFVGWAVSQRKSPQVHKRLMAYASMVLLGAALMRLLANTVPTLPPPLTIWLVYIPLIGAIALHDKRSLGRVHSATIRGGLAFTAATLIVTMGIPLLAG